MSKRIQNRLAILIVYSIVTETDIYEKSRACRN